MDKPNIVIQGSSFNIQQIESTSQPKINEDIDSIVPEPRGTLSVTKDNKKMNKTFYLDINNVKLYDRVIR